MNKTIYALLVGIDNYPAPVPSLRGSVNDITIMEQLLRTRLAAGRAFVPQVLKNSDATRQAVIAGFDHLRLAGPGDVALFYYSGHGSQEPAPPEFWHLEPDHLNETLVCYDSRLPGNYDLADKELAKLIAAVAARGAHVLVILDSCHSGSGTRASDGLSVRRVPAATCMRPLDTYLVTLEEATELAARSEARDVSESSSGWLTLPQGRHILLAACRDEEEAKETSVEGQARGVFSSLLTETLQRSPEGLTYRDLFKHVEALVRLKVVRQSPVLEPGDDQQWEEPFLGGAIQAHPPYFTASFDQNEGWVIDGGAAHNLQEPSGAEATVLALFPVISPDGRPVLLTDLKSSVGTARISERLPAHSKLQLDANTQLNQTETYKAVIIATPLPPLGVQFSGDEQGLALVRAALSKAGPTAGASLLVCETTDAPELLLTAHPHGYRLRRTAEDQPLAVDIAGLDEASALKVVARLEHIARWVRIAALANTPVAIRPEEIEMYIEQLPGPHDPPGAPPQNLLVPLQGMNLPLAYSYDGQQGKWVKPQFKVRLKNNSQQELHCSLLDLTDTFKVWSGLLPGGVWLKPGEEAWALNGKAISAEVPHKLWQAGLTQINDLLKLIVSTEQCDATSLEQRELDVQHIPAAVTRGSQAPRTTLERLMRRVQTRHLSESSEDDEVVDWLTREVKITTTRPLESVPVPATGQVALLPQVTLAAHPSFKAQARLNTLALAHEELRRAATGGPPLKLPRLLRDDASLVCPLQFSASRSGEPGLSVLEFTDVDPATVSSVTSDQPLKLRLDRSLLAENEYVLPVGYDGEFFLPLGRARRTDSAVEVALTRLPPPLVDSRSLTGSIRIFFEKAVTHTFGWEFKYPLLALAEADGLGGVNYDHDRDHVRARVANAQRILLYIHGIIGDTRGMAASARPSLLADPPLAQLADRYDVVLSFDYENLHTTIEDIARSLKARLAEAGLGPGHGKTFHIAAHSMGGLVSRWFIEREGGQQVVQHLAMLGTPNAGSPWSAIEDWLLIALGIGLNGLSTVSWPTAVLGVLVKGLETIDVSLDQMNPASPFMSNLAASPDPGVRYTIIAGNTSLLNLPTAEQGHWQRLLARLSPQRALHGTTALAFFNAPNDMAVSVESITFVPAMRTPAPVIRKIACDHISYFSTAAGLRALAEALAE